MGTSLNWVSLAHLRLEYQGSQEASTYLLSDWCSQGLDAVFVLEILNSIPEHLLYSPFHPNKEFVGRLVSVGKVESTNLFTASLIPIAKGLLGCYQNPFFGLSGSNVDVVVEDQHQVDMLIIRVFVRLPNSSSNDR